MSTDAWAATYRPGTSGAWRAPGRVNLIGEHTDYNDGFVLPFALAQATTVTAAVSTADHGGRCAARRRGPVTITAEDLVPGRVGGWAGYVAGVVWALRDAGYGVPAADLSLTSDVPVGAGLSSSAAIEWRCSPRCATSVGSTCRSTTGPGLRSGRRTTYVGMPCGIMDQAAATLCRAGHALFLDCRSLAAEHIPFDPPVRASRCWSSTRARRISSWTANTPPGAASCERAAALARRTGLARRHRPGCRAGGVAGRRDAPPGPACGDRERARRSRPSTCCATAGCARSARC